MLAQRKKKGKTCYQVGIRHESPHSMRAKATRENDAIREQVLIVSGKKTVSAESAESAEADDRELRSRPGRRPGSLPVLIFKPFGVIL